MELPDVYQRFEISMKLSRVRNKNEKQGGCSRRAAVDYNASKGDIK